METALLDMYRLSAELLLRASAFPTGLPSAQPEETRDWFLGRLERLLAEGRARGLPEADLVEARYALVAFIDEQVLRSSWHARDAWMRRPLQLVLYRENVAGENFFRRLRALLKDPQRLPAVQVYALCLGLGFRGVYEQAGDLKALAKFRRAAYRHLERALPSRALSSPHLDRGTAETTGYEGRPVRLAALLACLFASLVLLGCSWCVRLAEQRLDARLGAAAAEESRP